MRIMQNVWRIPILLVALLAQAMPCLGQNPSYPWQQDRAPAGDIASRIPPPEGFQRTETPAGAFAHWLRHLPLKQEGTPVCLYDGRMKPNQQAHYAVIDIDTGTGDLQQCADAVIRLRAEYLYSQRNIPAIHFNFTSGDEASFSRWISGHRPVVNGNRVTWGPQAERDGSYASFRAYLKTVFTYAGTYSLNEELKPRHRDNQMEIGDVFIQGGFPGHAVIVVDMARNPRTGEKAFLLAQSYMPAQDMHILKNPCDSRLSPWYRIPLEHTVQTPEWIFRKTDLRCFASEATSRQGRESDRTPPPGG